MNLAFERAKRVYALDRSATVIGFCYKYTLQNMNIFISGFLPGGNDTAIRRNTQITHHTHTRGTR
jgi:hypothetical protein